ncbi:hypothetical protein SAMN05444360_11647 [Chryseobacterium carnipullorum]|nr:hypothetical protein SAMN05444360_11647 [Chryseobacterium carnipullorum]
MLISVINADLNLIQIIENHKDKAALPNGFIFFQ